MPTKKQAPTEEEPKDKSELASFHLRRFADWRSDLERYWDEMDRWQEMYEFYRSPDERKEASADISLNTPFAIVESQIAKENQAHVRITAKSKPDDDIGEFDRWVESVLKDAMEDRDVAEIHGPLRKTREKWSRALKVVGNAAAEINWCYRVRGGKVIANNFYVRTRHFKSVIFNPSMQFDRSDCYYVEDYVSMADLEANEEYSSDSGAKRGLYSNLGALKIKLKANGKLGDDSDVRYISGDTRVSRKNKPIRLVTCWEGTRMLVIARAGDGEGVVIRDEDDPLKLGGHNLILGMRYIVEGRPYAYGEIAAIYKPVRAQDTIVSQGIEIVERYLRGSYVLGTGVDPDDFALVLANGGVMLGDPNSVHAVPVNVPPPAAFQQAEALQQAIERAARYSPYSSGVGGSATDQTQGTKGGILALQGAAEPNVETQLDDVQDMFMNPIASKGLKMIGEFMEPGEVRYGLLEGKNRQWVSASKGILQGRATLADMVTVGLLEAKELPIYTHEAAADPMSGLPLVDPETGKPPVDPATGQYVVGPEIPGAAQAAVFDVDWVVGVDMSNQSAADRQQRSDRKRDLIELGFKLGVPMSPERALALLAHDQDFEDIDEIMLSPDERQAALPPPPPPVPVPPGMPPQASPAPIPAPAPPVPAAA